MQPDQFTVHARLRSKNAGNRVAHIRGVNLQVKFTAGALPNPPPNNLELATPVLSLSSATGPLRLRESRRVRGRYPICFDGRTVLPCCGRASNVLVARWGPDRPRLFRLPPLNVALEMGEFVVRRTGTTFDAVISSRGKKVASLHDQGNRLFRLSTTDGKRWEMDPRVHGEIRPFSMDVRGADGPDAPRLTIRNHVFYHGSRAYMLTGIPEDVRPADHVLGKRHVNRLDNFPFSRLEDIDLETWGRLRRHRGVSVGTVDGFGPEGFRVELLPELQDIGIPLAAAAYLLYSTG